MRGKDQKDKVQKEMVRVEQEESFCFWLIGPWMVLYLGL